MARKETVLVINGEEHISEATKSADGALAGFMSKIPGWGKTAAILAAAYKVVSEAVEIAKEFVMDSIVAYDAFAASQTKLWAQSKLTGLSMREMNALVDQAREKFGLGTVAAVDIAAGVAKFATAAGDSSRAGELMATALELGAAAGMSAKEVADGLSSALAGNDEWLNRLGLANPSQLWKDYAAANGRAVGTLTDTEQKLAVMTAIMDAGNKVAGTYAERMESGAGAQEQLNNTMDKAKVAFGAALQPARVFVLQALTALVNITAPVIIGLGKMANFLTVTVVGSFRLAQSAVGSVLEALGKLTGISSLEAFGARHANAMREFTEKLDRMRQGTNAATEELGQHGKAHQLAAVRIEASAEANKKYAETTEQAAVRLNKALDTKLGAPLRAVIGLTEGAIRSLADAAKDQLPPESAAQFSAHMRTLADRAKEVGDRITTVPKPVADGAKSAKEMAREVEAIGRSAIDAASAFGVIDDRSARSLNSAVNIAASLGKMMASGFTFGGVVGVIGGVASIVSTMMQGDKERRELTRANTEALNKLRTEGLRLSNKASGQQIAGVAGALTADQIKLLASMTTSTGRDAGNQMLVRLLADKGLRLSDLDAVASELGFKIRRDNGQIELSQLPLLFQALQQNGGQLTRIGQGFAEQFAFFKDEQRVRGASGISGLQGVVDFVRNVGGARALQGLDLSDPGAARNQLLNMLTGLNNDVFSPADFGRLTGEEFKSVLLELIGLLDNLKDTTPVTTSPPTTTTDDVVSTTAGVTLSVQSVQEVIEAMHTGVEGVLKEHTTLHNRIALATEGSWTELQLMNDKMDDLIAATTGQVNRINRELGELRLTQLANAGRGPEF